MVEPVPDYVETAVYLYCLLVAIAGVSLHVWIRTGIDHGDRHASE
ncbi:hypothetical protein ACYJ1Y_14610 [Natrialbaceae archaeon A-gly3]